MQQRESGYWTKEHCAEEAKKYSTRAQFQRMASGAWNAAHKKGWLDEICLHMEGRIKHKAGWWRNIEHCIETASLYNSPCELKKAESGCYVSIIKHKWQEVCYKHMDSWKREYTDYELIKIAKRCNTHKEFRTKYPGAIHLQKTRIYLKEYVTICLHSEKTQKVAYH